MKSEDVDVAAPPDVFINMREEISAGAPNFSLESDGKIAFDAPQGFRVQVNALEIGSGSIERIHATEPWYGGSVASMPDLLLLRAVTVVDRGGAGDVWDFRWLLGEVAKMGNFPAINDEELEILLAAAARCMGPLGRLVVVAILGANNEAAALRLLQF